MTVQPRPLSDARRRVVLVAGWVLVLLVALLLAGYLSGGWDWYGGYTLLVTALAALSLAAGTSRVPTRWRLLRYAAFLACGTAFFLVQLVVWLPLAAAGSAGTQLPMTDTQYGLLTTALLLLLPLAALVGMAGRPRATASRDAAPGT
ncbi:MAG: hypothetical protein FWJ70_16185 [Micromonosporaceae bacterium]|jgi:hypothetical protein